MSIPEFFKSVRRGQKESPASSKLFDTGHAYRTANWLTYYAVAAAVVLAFACLGLVGVIIALQPLKTVQPYLVTFSNKSEQVATIEPLHISKKENEVYIGNMCAEYVRLREVIDLQSELKRYDQCLMLSEDAVGQAFKQLYRHENPDSPLEKFRKESVTRSVLVNSVASLAPSLPNVWQVTWSTLDEQAGKTIGEGVWVSTLTIGFKTEVKEAEMGVNPFGFQVKSYSITKRK